MGSVGGWLGSTVTLCVFVIFHKLRGYAAGRGAQWVHRNPSREGVRVGAVTVSGSM